jgi:RND family efflux transporter MFP subunit
MHIRKGIDVFCRLAVTAALLAAWPVSAQSLEPVRGVVKSVDEAVISVDLNARVLEIPVNVGESFARDDILIRFDCAVQLAEVRAAEAGYTALRSAYKNNKELQQYGAIGEFDVQVSKAEMEQARAQADAIAASTRDCEIRAPYAGSVADLTINAFETPGASQPLMKIVSSDAYEIQLIVPSLWLAWLRPGHAFEFLVDETGVGHKASVKQLGAEVDAVSRTVSVFAEFDTLPAQVLAGMSGTASFSPPN